MKVVLLFALFAYCNGEYPAGLPEINTPSDSYGPPAPSDSYGAPAKTLIEAKPLSLPEIQSTAAPEPIITETVAAAPAQSATFNFLSDLAGPSVFGIAESNLKNSAILEQQPLSAPATEELQLNIPGLIPPITNIPLPPLVPPAQVLPPAVFPPAQAPIPVPPLPVQPLPVQQLSLQPLSLPVQPLPLETRTTTAPAQLAQFTTQIQHIPIQRVQSTFIPQTSYRQYYLPTPLSFQYSPYFLQSNTLPSSLYSKFLTQAEPAPQATPELLNIQLQPATNILESSAPISTAPTVRIPATSYGTPAFEASKKK